MTRILVAAGLLASVLACTPTPGDPLPDLGSDLGGTHDCTNIFSCENGCSVSACFSACVTDASAKGRGEYGNALGCAQQVCAGQSGMTARCMLDTSTNTFVDLSGGTPGDCAVCLNNASARLFGISCQPASDPYCNPSKCKPATDLCLAD